MTFFGRQTACLNVGRKVNEKKKVKESERSLFLYDSLFIPFDNENHTFVLSYLFCFLYLLFYLDWKVIAEDVRNIKQKITWWSSFLILWHNIFLDYISVKIFFSLEHICWRARMVVLQRKILSKFCGHPICSWKVLIKTGMV